jgi:hypothetical protein
MVPLTSNLKKVHLASHYVLQDALQLSYLNQLHKAGKITESEYLRMIGSI